MRPIDAIVVHCTADPDTAFNVGAAEIRRYHMAPPPAGRGWSDIGYHYVVRRNGTIEVGRPESEVGAHCQNGFNQRSVGVAWVGIGKPSSEQRAALVRHVRDLMRRYGVPVHSVFGHREADPSCGKACPVIDMIDFRAEVGRE